jgi:exportin-1
MAAYTDVVLCVRVFVQHHIQYLETQPGEHDVLRMGLENLIGISYVEDTEVFKTCLDYWNVFVADIYTSQCQSVIAQGSLAGAGRSHEGSTTAARVRLHGTTGISINKLHC